ncbi:MAG: GTP-binding protein [Promethearchaeota archaeon]|nr:MAG: GTP-binding protein [Candidatus Lokiarchaeota archaeon]
MSTSRNLSMQKYYMFKILIAGDASVGKTSLLRRYVDGMFDESTIMTVGVDFFLKEIEFDSIATCALQLWDLGGQQRFRHLLEHYVMGARGALILIDLTTMPDIDNIVEWVNIVRVHDINLPIVLVGTKSDLEEAIVLDDDTALNIKDAFHMVEYIKTSSKTGHNIDKVFKEMVKNLMKIT